MTDSPSPAVPAAATSLKDSAIDSLRSTLRGEVLHPGSPGYDAARSVWNAMIDKRPALIARCRGIADVIAAVNFARERGLLLSIRGGGHNVAGLALCDGGITIDCSPMRGVRVDPIGGTVRAEAGVTWGELDRETQAFGLATTGGMVSTTGIAGLTLGGGLGWQMGRHGLASDNLLSADIVTADGRLLTANATQHEDLFWALRGGGGNFGVVTSFKYRLHGAVPYGPGARCAALLPALLTRVARRSQRVCGASNDAGWLRCRSCHRRLVWRCRRGCSVSGSPAEVRTARLPT